MTHAIRTSRVVTFVGHPIKEVDVVTIVRRTTKVFCTTTILERRLGTVANSGRAFNAGSTFRIRGCTFVDIPVVILQTGTFSTWLRRYGDDAGCNHNFSNHGGEGKTSNLFLVVDG